MANEYLTPDQVVALEAAAANARDALLVHLLYRLGCRISEELGLSVDDIDFTSGRVTITHLKAKIVIMCKQCGARLGLKHEYCPKCGAKSESSLASRPGAMWLASSLILPALQCPYVTEYPPSTMILWPVMKSDAFEDRNTAAPASSLGSPKRPAGVR